MCRWSEHSWFPLKDYSIQDIQSISYYAHIREMLPRRIASRVIQWYGLIHETWYCTPDQITIMKICLLYAFFSDILSDFKTCFGL